MNIEIKRLDPSMPLPSYAMPGDAGFDLYCRETVILASKKRVQIKTGIALAIPEGYVGLVWDKSGISQKFGIKSLGGVIDSGYRGEIMVGMVNLSSETYTFEKGQKVAQILIQKVEQATLVEVVELSVSERGERGFGSTGK